MSPSTSQEEGKHHANPFPPLRLTQPRSTTILTGRTGSGKSTLAAALLNIVMPDPGGAITIDNVSLTDINVTDLRRRITFIPQDPVLFLGTVRENLDPIDEYTDDQCSDVLDRICAAISLPEAWTLDTRVESGGRNFSQGQRQVFGIARAILRRSSIVILDEIMASIDVETADQLQRILREELRGATIVMIAHRLDGETMSGVDYEIALEKGRVVRQGRVTSKG
jgi:ABC-type multidrug transport system fused ATPase/permease subunit